MRGEHIQWLLGVATSVGSSPRARGAHLAAFKRVHRVGIIPACAGSTHRADVDGRCRWDHPRVRGEHPMQPSELAGQTWIIPACAGSTLRGRKHEPDARDHPRVRGEHFGSRLSGLGAKGSSPRARGAPSLSSPLKCPAGIIPACAGSTNLIRSPELGFGDHPRVRGEHADGLVKAARAVGSSPRARGAHVLPQPDAQRGGIIPACAGSTPRSTPGPGRPRDHPRVRGEHAVRPPRWVRWWGSSPRARGAQRAGHVRGDDLGIIPACAGSTACAG